MFSYFRLNDPYRLILIFIVLLVMRMPVMLSNDALTVEELNYMLIGEKITEGADLYSQLWDNLAPLSALVYGSIDFLFGRSQTAYQILSLLLVFFQVFLFNRMFIVNKSYSTNTYVPGLLYGMFTSMFFDFTTLTPMLMGSTFLLLALHNIFQHIEFRAKRDEMILNIGLYLGIAYLFYQPIVVFGIATLIILLLLTGTVTRRYLLLLFGFAMPFIMASTLFLIQGKIQDFFYCFFAGFYHNSLSPLSWVFVALLFLIPLMFFLVGMIKTLGGARLTNYQSRIARSMFIWFVFGVVVLFLSDFSKPNSYIILVPSMAFFVCHLYLMIKRRFIAEIVFTVFAILLISVHFGIFFQIYDTTDYLNMKEYAMAKGVVENDKRILVLSEDLTPYLKAKSATPFLNWKLSGPVFKETEYYDNLTLVFRGLESDPPDVIIDEEDIMSGLLLALPKLRVEYERRGKNYYRISN